MGTNKRQMFSALRSRVTPRIARSTSRSYGHVNTGGAHPGDGLGGAEPSVMKEIGIATSLGVVGAIYWLSCMSENRQATKNFWKAYQAKCHEYMDGDTCTN